VCNFYKPKGRAHVFWNNVRGNRFCDIGFGTPENVKFFNYLIYSRLGVFDFSVFPVFVTRNNVIMYEYSYILGIFC